MNILLLSPYDAKSHQYWRNALVDQFPEHHWVVKSMAPRHFAWRVRGNSLSYAFEEQKSMAQAHDLVIATSMTDLSALRGMCPRLTSIPTLVYFHENQFAYPESDKAFSSIEPRILNLYTALSADHIAFNSQYNKDSFLQGAQQLLNKLPDHAPRECLMQIERQSEVLPVPLPEITATGQKRRDAPLSIVWNHRWEYDKGPDILLACVRQLAAHSQPFRIHIVGQQFRSQPEGFSQIKALLGDRLGHWGHIQEQQDYQRLLLQCDVVLSTAIHDFQGIAVLEAVAAGCIPLVPDRLAYTELFPSRFRYPDTLETENGVWHTCPDKEGASIATKLFHYMEQKSRGELPAPPNLDGLRWRQLKPAYQTAFATTLRRFQKRDIHMHPDQTSKGTL
ncbi:MAG: DUF3524 domain-containing protein [Oleiphilus sp.]|nr:MAG: DUF3524 domain-containing protein [Oleiphilus sp.]